MLEKRQAGIVTVKHIIGYSGRSDDKLKTAPEVSTYFDGRVASSIVPKSLHKKCEDHGLVGRLSDGRYAVGVFDGVGGYSGGDLASRIAAETTFEMLDKGHDTEDALRESGRRISGGRDSAGSATTACVATVDDHGNCKIVNIGDSRAYLVRKIAEGEDNASDFVSQLTVDQGSFGLEDEEEAKRLSRKLQIVGNDLSKLSSQEFDVVQSGRNIMRGAVGGRMTEIDVYGTKLLKGDRLVLITDGIGDVVTNADVADASGQKTPKALATGLMDVAESRTTNRIYLTKRHGTVIGKVDDRLVIVFEF